MKVEMYERHVLQQDDVSHKKWLFLQTLRKFFFVSVFEWLMMNSAGDATEKLLSYFSQFSKIKNESLRFEKW